MAFYNEFLSTIYASKWRKFYDIVKVNDRAKFDININWNSTQVSCFVKYGLIDEQLFKLLQNKQFASRVTDALLSKYIHINTINPKDQKLNGTKNRIDDIYLADFKAYLSKCTNKHGKPFASSSINVYVGGLKNEYMQAKVRPYSEDGLIESIKSIPELENLYDKVRNDAINGLISNSVHVGLRLYIEYRSNKHKEPISGDTFESTNSIYKPIKRNANTPLQGYRDFLRTYISTSGNQYSESTINLYINALHSWYVRGVISEYSHTEDIEYIKNIDMIHEIHTKVDTAGRLGLTNPVFANAVKLYVEYFSVQSSRSLDNNGQSTFSEHPKLKDKSIKIKSITVENIYITEGNPTSMFVQFINEIGPELVAAMHINYLGGELVSKTPNPKYINASKKLNGEYWVNTNSSTKTKIEQIRLICYNLDIDVKIEVGDDTVIENTLGMPTSKGRAIFSLNGNTPLNKRQSVLACVRLFMAINPNVPFEVVERNFPPELQGSYGVVAKLTKINSRISRGFDDNKRYFLDKDKILKTKDGIEFAVCHQWGNQFPKFQEYVRKRFGWTLEEVK